MKSARERAEFLLNRIDDLVYTDSLDEVESIITLDRAEVRREVTNAVLEACGRNAEFMGGGEKLMISVNMLSRLLDSIAEREGGEK